MATNIGFQAQGKTYKANATTTSQSILITSDSPCNQLLVSNHENAGGTGKAVYFLISTASNVTVTAPGNGTPQYCLVSVPATSRTFTVPYQFTSTGLYVAFICESGTAECYFTPGEGL
jgi:hypothetical protein